MNKEFIPYEQALALKELDFNEPCFGYYNTNTQGQMDHEVIEELLEWFDERYQPCNKFLHHSKIAAPLYQQAFRWFREKHGLYHHIVPEFYTKGINFNWQILWYLPKEEWTKHVISDGTGLYGDNGEYPTQEEAELSCLNELIKIVKNGNTN